MTFLFIDNALQFPKDYPTSCLLGCVNVEDCLEQEEYQKKYPNGESNSPYVLICSNPIILPIFYPIVGKHKICNDKRNIFIFISCSLKFQIL